MKMKSFILACFFATIFFLLRPDIISFASNTNPVPVFGPVISVDNGRIKIDSQAANGYRGELVLSTAEQQTKIIDAVTGYPMSAADLTNGQVVYAYIGNTMTASLPPVTNATIIIGNIPQDYKVPAYIQIQSATYSSSKLATILTSTSGNQYTIPASCSIIPYLTKNFVTVTDLTKDRTCLIWSDNNNQATKVILFAKEDTSGAGGWIKEQHEWYYYKADGTKHTGWLLENGDWFYLNPSSGIMQTGFLMLNGKIYYLLEDGRMLTSARTFIPDQSGVLH